MPPRAVANRRTRGSPLAGRGRGRRPRRLQYIKVEEEVREARTSDAETADRTPTGRLMTADDIELIAVETVSGIRYYAAPQGSSRKNAVRQPNVQHRAERDDLQAVTLPEPGQGCQRLDIGPTAVNVLACSQFLSTEEAATIREEVLTKLEWKSHEIVYKGRPGVEPRQTCCFTRVLDASEPDLIDYPYSGHSHLGQAMPSLLLPLIEKVEQSLVESGIIPTPKHYNYVLCSHYRNGRDYVGWHSDDATVLEGSSAMITLGAQRDILMRTRKLTGALATRVDPAVNEEHTRLGGRGVRISAGDGDLIVMDRLSQLLYRHCMPRRRPLSEPRVLIILHRVVPAPAA